MPAYLPLAITFLLGVSGLFFRTRREEPQSLIHRPTVWGWLVLLLLVCSLGAGVLLEAQRQQRGALAQLADSLRHVEARQRYDRLVGQQREQILAGKLAALRADSGFRMQLKVAADQLELASDELGLTTNQLEYLRRLVLLQHDLSAIEIAWRPLAGVLDGFVDSLRAAYADAATTGAVAVAPSTDFAYLVTAVRHGEVTLRRDPSGGSSLSVRLSRPQGMLRRRLRSDGPETRAFLRALPALRADRFTIELSSGLALANLEERDLPTEIRLGPDSLTLVLEPPGLRLGLLEHARVSFRSDGLPPPDLPREIVLRSRDSRLLLEQHLVAAWHTVRTDCVQSADEMTDCGTVSVAGPYALAAALSPDLLPPPYRSRRAVVSPRSGDASGPRVRTSGPS